MARIKIIFVTLLFSSYSFSQLADIKILLPKEIGFSYYEFAEFFPDEKYFVTSGNSLAVYNTETSEIIDEYDLTAGAKNLAISKDGKLISITVNNELLIFSFSNFKLELVSKIKSIELLKGIPNAQYYSSVPFAACFFTEKPNEMYLSIAAFTMIYDIQTKTVLATHTFKLGDYVIHGAAFEGRRAVILAVNSGTSSAIVRQSVTDLSETTEVIKNVGSLSKLRLRDSLLFCFTADKYFVLNLDNAAIVHEVRVPRITYDKELHVEKKYIDQLNKRPAISIPDTTNFAADEYVYDIDFLPQSGTIVYATSKAIKYFDLKTKKAKAYKVGFLFNLKISEAGNRMIGNGYSQFRSLRVFDPSTMNLISERPALTTSIYTAKTSPNNRWLVTNSNTSAFIWDLTNFTKYAELKDPSKNDSSSIVGVYFLNDSELVVNSGSSSVQKMGLALYNINKKKFIKTIKKGVFAYASGLMNHEFYYCDQTSLHIINLKTLVEEKYDGMFSLSISPQYQVVSFSDNLVFIPESGKFKIVNRKTKGVVYENTSWSMNVRVIISPDEKFVFTTSQIKIKKVVNGHEVEIPTNAVVKIDLDKKQIAKDYAQTYFPYDFKMGSNGKTIGIWYVKHDMAHSDSIKETMYTLYDLETAAILYTKGMAQTKEIIANHTTSDNGKYFALDNYLGTYLKVFDGQGELMMDLSYLNISNPKLFFNEALDRLIITSVTNPLATFVDLKQKKIIGQLANANDEQYFLVTADLHYLGSKEFIKNIRFKYQSEIFSFEQFDAYLNQPHRVLRAFGCKDSAMIKAYETAYLKRMKLLGFKPEVSLSFSNLPSFLAVTLKETKPNWVNFNVSANKGKNKLSKLEVFNNGSLIYSESIVGEKKNKLDLSLLFETASGINRFEFIIKDELGFESPRITRFYNNTTIVKPNLFLVVIASEKFKNEKYNLSYAVKDASDMANTMSNSKSFDKIIIKKMFNESFNNDSLSSLQTFFANAGINDVVMVFFAGHGYLDDDLSYYFPTYYTDFTDPKINSVAYKSFEKLFQNMKPSRKLMFIDACFSGEVDEDDLNNDSQNETDKKDTTRSLRFAGSTFAQSTALEMSKAIFSDLRQNSGATIISSAGGTEAAFEGEKWNNGLFTHCVLEGLANYKADKNQDGKVTLSELQKYVSEEVYRLSDGKQSPTYRMENTVLDYDLW